MCLDLVFRMLSGNPVSDFFHLSHWLIMWPAICLAFGIGTFWVLSFTFVSLTLIHIFIRPCLCFLWIVVLISPLKLENLPRASGGSSLDWDLWHWHWQVDLGEKIQVWAVATQGSKDLQQWIRSYTLAFSQDGKTFSTYAGDGKNPTVSNTSLVILFSTDLICDMVWHFYWGLVCFCALALPCLHPFLEQLPSQL